VPREKFEEAWNPNQVAISLSGEPTMYKFLADLLLECHKRGIRTFLVTNGTSPAVLERLDPLPYQLYVTVAGPNEDVSTAFAPRRPPDSGRIFRKPSSCCPPSGAGPSYATRS